METVSDENRLRVRVVVGLVGRGSWVRVERAKEPMAPGTLCLEKACQGNPSKALTLLFLHLSGLENPQY